MIAPTRTGGTVQLPPPLPCHLGTSQASPTQSRPGQYSSLLASIWSLPTSRFGIEKWPSSVIVIWVMAYAWVILLVAVDHELEFTETRCHSVYLTARAVYGISFSASVSRKISLFPPLLANKWGHFSMSYVLSSVICINWIFFFSCFPSTPMENSYATFWQKNGYICMPTAQQACIKYGFWYVQQGILVF
jgi:hypothetical protein